MAAAQQPALPPLPSTPNSVINEKPGPVATPIECASRPACPPVVSRLWPPQSGRVGKHQRLGVAGGGPRYFEMT